MPESREKGQAGSLVNISVEDFFGAGRVAQTLKDALVAGIGPALEPWFRSRLAKAGEREVRSYVKAAKASGLDLRELEISTVGGRASIRLRAEAIAEQESREAVAIQAVKEFVALREESRVAIDPPILDPEWLNRFWKIAENISSEELQGLFGRILARKASGAGIISARTLGELSLLDAQEVSELTRIAPLVCSIVLRDRRVHFLPKSLGTYDVNSVAHSHASRLRALNDRLEGLLRVFDEGHFGSIGFLSEANWGQQILLQDMVSPSCMWIAGHAFEIVSMPIDVPANTQLAIGVPFSKTGAEVLSLIRTEPSQALADLLSEFFGAMEMSFRPAKR